MDCHDIPSLPASGIDDDGGRHHGEYKVPGGKLVVADFDVVDGVLAHVSLSGDFFLEPDEALLGDQPGAHRPARGRRAPRISPPP